MTYLPRVRDPVRLLLLAVAGCSCTGCRSEMKCVLVKFVFHHLYDFSHNYVTLCRFDGSNSHPKNERNSLLKYFFFFFFSYITRENHWRRAVIFYY